MKNLILTWVAVTLFTVTAISQEGFERIEALKISFITKRLSLSPEEAQVFWPVYNKYRGEMDEIEKNRRALWKNKSGTLIDMEDAEVSNMMDKMMKLDSDELKVKQAYHGEFLKVLPVKKVARLYLAEREFKIWLLRHMQGAGKRKGDTRSQGILPRH